MSAQVTPLPTMMRAAMLRGPYDMTVADLARPTPGSGEVLVRMIANGICGSDLHFWHAGPAGPPGVLGHEMCAEIVAVGAGVPASHLGRRGAVWAGNSCGRCALCVEGLGHFCIDPPNSLGGFRTGALGGLAQFAVCEPHRVIDAAPTIDAAVVTLAEPLGNAVRSLDRDGVRDARHCVVLGCGPLGLAHVAVARTLGIRTVVAVEGRARRAAMARALGADDVLAPDDDVASWIRQRFGVGVDLVVECAGLPATTYLGGAIARPGGTLLLMGICGAPMKINTYRWIEKELTVRTSVGTGAAEQRRALELLQSGVIDGSSLVTSRISLAEVPEAFAALDAGSDEVKIVVEHD